MITVLSPAKKLSKDCLVQNSNWTLPNYLDYSKKLVSLLKSFDPPALMGVMGISENLSVLNWERYQNWNLPFSGKNAREALFTFQGDTYTGLDASSLDEKDILFAQDHTRILSGLYGILKPLDLIMPYRLEMGTKLNSDKGKNLYEFWGNTLSEDITRELNNHLHKVIVNCASVEYFKSVDNDSLSAEIVTPVFKEIKNGKMRVISLFAKRARGMMARYIIQNKINNPNEILNFNFGGYRYDKSLSNSSAPVFLRNQP
ncbi:MAG: peroxide stress protein YaaA [Fidelibacterota bacterium]